MLGVLMVIHGTGNSNVITSQAMRILKLLIQLVLWSFSFFATPICMAHLTALLEKRCAQLPEVALPEPIPLSRSAKPIRRSTALVTAGCFTVAALGLNLSYVYSVFTGKANFSWRCSRIPPLWRTGDCLRMRRRIRSMRFPMPFP